ncbi:fructose-bisphosphatase class II [Sphingopyxis sp. SE2]|uniref:fructose-bisphosphatase class II n=1 Tax=Sphingopyxis sp. SE2 TaxID=1586240 RepID=UPI003918FD22
MLEDVARGDYIVAATGVTDGSLLRGGGRVTTESVVMRPITGTFRWVRTEHRQTEGKSAYL